MKKFELVLKDNEELIVDCDDLMEQELKKFHESIKGLKLKEARLFNNWVKIYKMLNYDIIEGIVINKVYKFNNYSAIIELTFRGHKEYDLLNLNPETMTVAVMNVKEKAVRPYIVRRLLIPNTVEEALSFAKSKLVKEGIESVSKTIKELETKGDKYDVTDQLNINNETFEKIKEETKQEVKEEKKDKVKQEVKEEKKEDTPTLDSFRTWNVVRSSVTNSGVDVLAIFKGLR